jgi:hypothetical protein
MFFKERRNIHQFSKTVIELHDLQRKEEKVSFSISASQGMGTLKCRICSVITNLVCYSSVNREE